MNRSNERMLMLGALLTLFGLVLLLSNLDALPVDSGAMWGIMLSVLAVVFAVCYARDREQWWALVVACVLALMAWEFLLAPLSRAQRRLLWGAGTSGVGVVFLTGLGLTFGALALLRNEDGRLGWAQYPAISLLALAALLLLIQSPWTGELLVPLCLLALGFFKMARN